MRKILIKVFPIIIWAFISGVIFSNIGEVLPEIILSKWYAIRIILGVTGLLFIGYSAGTEKLEK